MSEATDDAPRGQMPEHDEMAEAPAHDEAPVHDGDELVVRVTVSQLSLSVSQPPDVIEAVVREELQRRRKSARIQAFVPILTERAARRRLVAEPPA